jgi:hypothetical protein
MDPTTLQLIAGLGPTAGCVAIVYLFNRYLANHLSANTLALRDTCVVLSALKTAVEGYPRRTESRGTESREV